MKGMSDLFGAMFTVIALCMPASSCSRPDGTPGSTQPAPVNKAGADVAFPSAAELASGNSPLSLRSNTKIVVRRGSSIVTITDVKRVRLGPPAGPADHRDFSIEVQRNHAGSESGDTRETFEAVRIGRDYWTRGTGGPFVRWDDALHEPDRALSMGLGEARSLLDLGGECLGSREEGGNIVIGLVRDGCVSSSGRTDAPMSVVFHSIEGESTLSGRPWGNLNLKMTIAVQADGHGAEVEIDHSSELSRPGPDEAIEAPETSISSRRERPVRMVKKVLSGLVDEWGPGAPDVLKDR